METPNACKRNENNFENAERLEEVIGKILLIPDGHRVVIKDVECNSKEVYTFLESSELGFYPVKALLNAIETGVAVLRRASAKIDNDYVSKLAIESFGKLETTIKSFIEKNLDPSEQGSLARRINNTFQGQHAQIKELVAKGDCHVNEFKMQLDLFSQSIQNIIKSAVSSTMSSDQTGISILLREVKSEVQTLRDAIVSKATQATSSAHLKGANFEDDVFNVINSWAQIFQGHGANVIVEDVRSISGPLGKQGDAVVRLVSNDEHRICVEAKAQASMSTAKIIEVCKAAAENRNAEFVIYVASDPIDLPGEIGPWAQFENKIITSMSGFAIALKIAACQCLLQKAIEKSNNVDVQKGLSLLQEIENTMKKFGVLLSTARVTVKNATKSQEIAVEIRDTINETLEQLFAILSPNHKKD